MSTLSTRRHSPRKLCPAFPLRGEVVSFDQAVGCAAPSGRARYPNGRTGVSPLRAPAPQDGGVLQDVDDSVRAFLRARAQITNDVEIVFDAPTRDWAARRNSPALDVFLYDIRENLDRRQALLEDTRGADGLVTGRPFATRWYNCSYLITAWTQRPEDEHRLLGSVLMGFLEVHALPREVLAGALAQSEREVFLTIGRPLAQERSISDIWSALGGELKPSLDLVLVVPFESTASQPFGPPVVEAPSVHVGDPEGGASAEDREGGHRRAKPGPVGRAARGPKPRSTLLDRRAEALGREEGIGGSKRVPGRRFGFAVHEPSAAELEEDRLKSETSGGTASSDDVKAGAATGSKAKRNEPRSST